MDTLLSNFGIGVNNLTNRRDRWTKKVIWRFPPVYMSEPREGRLKSTRCPPNREPRCPAAGPHPHGVAFIAEECDTLRELLKHNRIGVGRSTKPTVHHGGHIVSLPHIKN